MTYNLGLSAIVIVALTTQATAQSSAKPQRQPLSQQDQEFLSYAATDNQAEIALCMLAEKKAQSPAVKAFARLMIDDHVQIESRLASLADAEKATLPEGVGEDGKKTHDKLDPLEGDAFDAAFLKAQIEDHSNDIKKFDREASDTKNDAMHQYASQTGPILEQHLALAQAVQKSETK